MYYGTAYDVILAETAAAKESLLLVDEILVKQRRHVEAATYLVHDKHRDRSSANVLYMLKWSIANYRSIKPLMRNLFTKRLALLNGIKADTQILRDAKKIYECECEMGLWSMIKQTMLYVKYRHVMFFAYEKDPIAFVRSLLYPLMHIYNYRYLRDKR